MRNAVPTLGVREAVVGRRSVRRFLATPVPSETVSAILAEAARAPSGTNMQPWKVYVVTGTARDRLCRTVYWATIRKVSTDIDFAPKGI
ncbi:nitroreductase family protein [Mesorhizobium sp. f-mel]